jgi:hypothetical protein
MTGSSLIQHTLFQEQFGIGLMSRGADKWDYSFPQSYVIALMDYDDNAQSDAIRHEYALLDVDGGRPFTDRLKFITLELPKYQDPADPRATALDKLCFALHNMRTFRNRTEYLQGKFFELLFEKAEIAKFAPHEVIKYEKDMLTQWDIDEYVGEQVEKGVKEGLEKGLREGMAKGMEEGMAKGMKEGRAKGMKEGMKEGRAKGMKEGMQKGRAEILNCLIASGMTIDEVADRLGLTVDEVLKLTGSSH